MWPRRCAALRRAAAAGRRRVHAELGTAWDEAMDGDGVGPVMGPAMADAQSLHYLRDLLPFVVGVGEGAGVLLRLHRDVPRTSLKEGDAVIATVSSLIWPHRGLDGVCRTLPHVSAPVEPPHPAGARRYDPHDPGRRDGAEGSAVATRQEVVDVPVTAMWTQRRSSLSETLRSGAQTNDSGVALLIPDAGAARRIVRAARRPLPEVPLSGLAYGRQVFGAHWDRDEDGFVGSVGMVERRLPFPALSGFEPDWRDCYAGGPLAVLFTGGGQPKMMHHRPVQRRRVSVLSRNSPEAAPAMLLGLAWRGNHRDPYNPLVEAVDLNNALHAPMCISEFRQGLWKDRWWNGDSAPSPGGQGRGAHGWSFRDDAR